jgi:nicotinamide-nucleotide amidase
MHMICEVVAVGTELLLGQIVDTNSSWIGEQLALAGIDCLQQVKVGDNLPRVVEALRRALERSDAVICCGGLGPTQDDLTRDAIAELMGAPLVRDEAIADRIRAMFASRGREMPLNNLRQADVPLGATTIPQQPGTAPGLIAPVGDKVIYAVPGVPYEMQIMVAGTVIPELQARAGVSAVILSRTLRTWGQSESGLAEMLAERIDELDGAGNPTLAFLASGIEGIKVRVTAKAATEAEALAALEGEERVLRAILGDLVFGLDDETMEHAVLALLRRAGLTLAVAESVTGGTIAARLHSVPGASEVFRGGVVSDVGDVRRALLGVAGDAISEQAAGELALGARKLLGTDVGIATSAATGPDDPTGLPPGTVCLGVAIGEEVSGHTVRLPGDRERVRQFATISVLDALRKRLAARGA